MKLIWENKKPDRPGWFWYKSPTTPGIGGLPVICNVALFDAGLYAFFPHAGFFVAELLDTCLWAAIPEPEEAL